jgi:hypothetical protein
MSVTIQGSQSADLLMAELLCLHVLQVKSVHQRDVLYCLHESGSVSAKFRRRQLAFVGSPLDAPAGSVCSLGKFSYRETFLFISIP